MKKITLNTSKATATEIAVKASTIVSKMTGNANFPAPSPVLNSITAQINAMNAKITEQEVAFRNYQQKTAEMHVEKNNLNLLLQTEANYVQLISNGDEIKILSAGFDVKESGTPVGLLPAPKNTLAIEGANEGEIQVNWKKVNGAKTYLLEMSYDISNADNWEFCAVTTRTKHTLKDLESGKRIWLRVAPVNASGQGSFSDVTTKTIP